MRVIAIAAMAENRVIGFKNSLPWNIPEDWRWFKQATMGSPVMMGSSSYLALPSDSRPLPGRTNIVISRTPAKFFGESVELWDSPISCVEHYRNLDQQGIFWVAGGGEIYRETVPFWDELYLSLIPGRYEGDTYFPDFESSLSLAKEESKGSFLLRHYIRR